MKQKFKKFTILILIYINIIIFFTGCPSPPSNVKAVTTDTNNPPHPPPTVSSKVTSDTSNPVHPPPKK